MVFCGFFSISRGERKRYPLSPYVFIKCTETLAEAIRNDKRKKGIKVDGREYKICQYVEETIPFWMDPHAPTARQLHLKHIKSFKNTIFQFDRAHFKKQSVNLNVFVVSVVI